MDQPGSNDDMAKRARIELKQTFMALTHDQEDIQQLFKTVATQLQDIPDVDEKHPLCYEWDDLRQRHRRTYRESQRNAERCASFLRNFAEILIPLSQSADMPLEQKKVMIGKFLETIPVHVDSAKETTEKFHAIAKDVETFPRRIVEAKMNTESAGSGLLNTLWAGIKNLCKKIWNMVQGLLDTIIGTFHAALQNLQVVRLSCFGGIISADLHLSQYPYRPLGSSNNEEYRAVKDNVNTLSQKLTAFDHAWHVVHLACSTLLSDISMAEGYIQGDTPVPQAYDKSLRSSALLHGPLVECLTSYALGKSPEFF